jgi:DNA-binding MarR family transcriptional regulator
MEGVPLPLIRAQLGHRDLSMTQRYVDHLAPAALINALRDRQWPEELLPPMPPARLAVISQGQPAPTAPVAPARNLPGDPTEPPPAPDRGRGAVRGKAHQRVLDVIASNGGRATQPQLTRALGVAPGIVAPLLVKLHADGLILPSGWYRDPRTSRQARVWRLAPPKCKVTLELHDPRERTSPVARRGYGPQRVLDVIAGLGGRASQAEIARELGVTPRNVAVHCRQLEQLGELDRVGLDKTNSNRGSVIWRLASPAFTVSAGGWRSMRIAVPGSNHGRPSS